MIYVETKIPATLRERNQWIIWKTIERDGKQTKLPFQVSGKSAKSNDKSTWTTFDAALEAATGDYALGFVFDETDGLCGIDLDGCRDPQTGKVAEWAAEWIRKFDSYAEVSPSQTGVKIFVCGENPLGSGRKVSVTSELDVGKEPGVEIYDRLRYFAVTGLRLGGVSPNVEQRQSVIDEFIAKFFPAPIIKPVAWDTPDAICERARKYLDKLPPAISGQSGHNATFHAACVLVKGFGLDEAQAKPLMDYYNQRCDPPWSERELSHKLTSALKVDGPRNYLRDVPLSRWDNTTVPNYSKMAPVPITDGVTLADAAELYLNDLDSGSADLIELGIAELDYSLGGGVAPGEMVIIASRPSHGKSAVALQCLDTCSGSGIKGLMISEEMSVRSIGKRTIQYVSTTPEEHWRPQRKDVAKAIANHFCSRSLVYVVEGCRTAKKAVDTIQWYVANEGIGVAVVDYAQLLASPGRGRYEQITETSIALRSVANETGIVVLVLCQLNREVEARTKFVPRSADLKDSGQLEQDADVVIFLVWPHRIDPKNDPFLYQIFVAKNRNRAINQSAFDCRFEPSRQRVVEELPKYDFKSYGATAEF